MHCSLCGCRELEYVRDISFSNGKTYKVYKCKECGMFIKVPY